jgi:hypothetical protein
MVHQGRLCLGFAELAVWGALGFDHLGGHAEADDTVDCSAVVGVPDGDLVAEEFCRAGFGVGDQRFVLRQLQLEIIMKERREAGLDLLGFGLRPGEPEELIICLCRTSGYAEWVGDGAGQQGLSRLGIRHNPVGSAGG